MNKQPIEKIASDSGYALDVHNIFLTIQGEGPHVGRPAVFVRLAGCNLQCPHCDTDYTEGREILTTRVILNKIEFVTASSTALVVITGGEPFRQDLNPLVQALLSKGYEVQIETNGTLPPKLLLRILDNPRFMIICSPKTGSINRKLMPFIDAFKYVIEAGNVDTDGLPLSALGHTAKPSVAKPIGPGRADRTVYIQPMDSKDSVRNQENLEATIDSCLKFGYTLGLQIHKVIEVE